MGYDATSEGARAAETETKAIDGDPYSVRDVEVDPSNSLSRDVADNDDDEPMSLGGFDGTSDPRDGASNRNHGRRRARAGRNSFRPRGAHGEDNPRDLFDRIHGSVAGRALRGGNHGNDFNDRYHGGGRSSYEMNHRPELSYDDNVNNSNRHRRHKRSQSHSRSRSPYRRDRSRSPYRNNRSRSPYRRNRSRSPYRHGRSRSPYGNGSNRPSHRRDQSRSRSPYRRDRVSGRDAKHGVTTGDKTEISFSDGRQNKGNGKGNLPNRAKGSNSSNKNNDKQNDARRKVRFDSNTGADEAKSTDPNQAEEQDKSKVVETEVPLSQEDEDLACENRIAKLKRLRAKFADALAKEQAERSAAAQKLMEAEEQSNTSETPDQPQQKATTDHPAKPNVTMTSDATSASEKAASSRIGETVTAVPNAHPPITSPDHADSPMVSEGPMTAEASQDPDATGDSKETFAVEETMAPKVQELISSINELGDHRRPDLNPEPKGAAYYDEMMMKGDDRFKGLNLNPQDFARPEDEDGEEDEDDKEDEDDSSEEEESDYDMFDTERPLPKTQSRKSRIAKEQKLKANNLIDDADDNQAYFKHRIGEFLDERYEVVEVLGKGMFAGVLRCSDLQDNGKLVAIKILRGNDVMRKSGLVETRLIQLLNEKDPKNEQPIVRFFASFEYKNHLSLVFENLEMNLRDVLKKFGRGVGLNIGALRSFSFQLFKGLHFLKEAQIVHADLKPDNILITQDLKSIKICDFGTSMETKDMTDNTGYLASRFYRAPEVMLGIPYDFGIDIWAIGCTLFELYSGHILFTGDDNCGMLKSIMESKGHLSLKHLIKGDYSGKYFDDDGTFISIEKHPKTHQVIVREISRVEMQPSQKIPARIKACADPTNKDEVKEAALLADLVDKCIVIKTARRLTPEQALRHPFIHRPKVNPVPQPKFKPSTLMGGFKQNQGKYARKRPLASDFIHDDHAQSPTSVASPVSSVPATPAATEAEPGPPRKKGFKKATTIAIN